MSYYNENREERLAYGRRYYQENREDRLEYGRRYNQEHLEERRAAKPKRSPEERKRERRRGRAKGYYCWGSMIARCYKSKHKGYHRYGGAGVTVCDRWRFGEDGKRDGNAS